MGMMFLQSRLSPATVDNMQQKMMMYGLPLIFGVMGFFFPSGLTLYILTNTTLSLLHTFYMKKFDKGAKLVMVTPPPASAKKDKEVVDAEAEEVDDDADEPEEPKGTKAAPASAQKSPASRRKRRRKH
jgi:YidC/Oxa1 family membrane protein insertase